MKRLAFRFALTTLLLVQIQQVSGQSTSTIWVLEQTCGVLGDQIVWASNNRVDIQDKASGIITTASAPDWKVLTIDQKSKTYAQCSIDQFKGFIPDKEFVDSGVRWSTLPLVTDKPTRVATVDATTYRTPQAFTDKQLKDMGQESAAMTFAKSAQYCVAQKIALPKQATRLIARFYQLPEKNGVPLQFRYYNLAGHMSTWLHTSSVKTASGYALTVQQPTAEYKKLATASDIRSNLRSTEATKKERKRRPLL